MFAQAVEKYHIRNRGRTIVDAVVAASTDSELTTRRRKKSKSKLSKQVAKQSRKKNETHHNKDSWKNKVKDVMPDADIDSDGGSDSDSGDQAAAAAKADMYLNNISLRFARRHPRTYLKMVGHLLVMSELVALMTPAIAMGIQWVTALCEGPPVPAIIELFMLGVKCVVWGHCKESLEDSWKNCILK